MTADTMAGWLASVAWQFMGESGFKQVSKPDFTLCLAHYSTVVYDYDLIIQLSLI